MKHTTAASRRTDRQGTVLILVLVVVATLTLGAYTFSELMITEVQATSMYSRQAESRAFAESGIEMAASVIAAPESDADELSYHNPERFQAQLIREGESERGNGYFSLVAPVEASSSNGSVRFGLMDESSRINLNAIVDMELSDEETRTLLIFLPGMTEEVADSILDYIDENDSQRTFGVESEYYEGLDPAYPAKNGPLETIDELLQVYGVTTELLYGEDANRNGVLDPNENDGEASPPFDDADGILNPGWAAFLTVQTKELNKRLDGDDRINVNDGVLTDLYDTLLEEFDEETATFVVAFRLNGPFDLLEGTEDGGLLAAAATVASTTDDQADDSNATANNRATEGDVADVLNAVGTALAGAITGEVTRGGMNLTDGAAHDLTSIYEMIGARVEVEIDDQVVMLSSPWADNPADMETYLPDILDRLTVLDSDTIPGRINVNQARLETLLGIPGMPEDAAIAIAESSMMDDSSPLRSTAGWLLAYGIVDLGTMVSLDRYVTGRGLIYRAQAVGYFGEGGGYTRLEATIDASEYPAKILSVSDLTSLGRGYTQQVLSGTTE